MSSRPIVTGIAVLVLFAGVALPGDAGTAGELHSVARSWNEELLDAIRTDRPKPPVHGRNLFHLSVAMWDAWAAYDPDAVGYFVHEKLTAEDVEAARAEAISYAAYGLLKHRFPGGGIDVDDQPCQPGAAVSLAAFDARMIALGYSTDPVSAVGDTPSALGTRIAQAIIMHGLSDGANEGSDLCYADDTGYLAINPSMVFELPGAYAANPNHWQPLAFEYLVLQNDIVIGQAVQEFVGVGWADVDSFALGASEAVIKRGPLDCTSPPSSTIPYPDPGCPPQLGGVGHDIVVDAVVELIRLNSQVDPSDGVEIDISPGVWANSVLGTDLRRGHPLNPFTEEPYAPNRVKRADYSRVLAEFWADGPDSETPPGHWNVLANEVSDVLGVEGRRLNGVGEAKTRLEWDVKLYLALNGAAHDSAVAAWGAKHYYDSSRPITLIRHMGELGQSSSRASSGYDPNGLPLVPGLIEQITTRSSSPGGPHDHLARYVGEIAIRAWLGTPEDQQTEIGGVDWIRAVEWMPYQAPNFVSPPFPGYISGHSTFSRAAAEVLAAFTGSPYFPGGIGTFVAQKDAYLRFENGPSETIALQWATYADAADEAGISRRYGGIHPYYDDYPGRLLAVDIGQDSFVHAVELYRTDDVQVCHEVEDDRATMTVDSTSLRLHLDHGDTLGVCAPLSRERALATSSAP